MAIVQTLVIAATVLLVLFAWRLTLEVEAQER
jgi:hypothetical protein